MSNETEYRRDDFELKITLIAAVASTGVIGKNGEIPWDYPSDMKHFKKTTTGHTLIMGRKTHESMANGVGGTLPNRTHYVLSTQDPEDIAYGSEKDVRVFNSVEELISHIVGVETDTQYYVVGGEEIYRQLLPYANEILLTYVHEIVDGDTVFPEFHPLHWETVEKKTLENDALNVVKYQRRF